MKTVRLPFVLAGFLLWTLSLSAQVTANASVTPGAIFLGQSVTIVRDGQADAGIAYTEGTIWAPDGSYEFISRGDTGSEMYTPHNGAGTYWLQFRVVDNNNAFVDQWISFTVGQATLSANASVAPGAINLGDAVTITRDGQSDAGIAYTEGTIWAPDGTYEFIAGGGIGSETYTPHSGAGTYWLQFRIVDNANNFVDQWISFTVM
jgi:hypothetical protein